VHSLLVAQGRTTVDVLWTMEECLRSGAASAVLGEVADLQPIALRRLQLAAEAGGITALLLRPFGSGVGIASATTCWRVGAVPSGGAGIGTRMEAKGEGLTPTLSRRRREEGERLSRRGESRRTELQEWEDPSRQGKSQGGVLRKVEASTAVREHRRCSTWEGEGEAYAVSDHWRRYPTVGWRVELLRCRAAVPARWIVDWCDATHRIAVAAVLHDRSVAAESPDRAHDEGPVRRAG
jgi:hypothetical protein